MMTSDGTRIYHHTNVVISKGAKETGMKICCHRQNDETLDGSPLSCELGSFSEFGMRNLFDPEAAVNKEQGAKGFGYFSNSSVSSLAF